MSLNPFIQPFSLSIKSSIQKAFVVCAPHLMGLILILSIDVFPLWMKLVVATFIGLSFIYFSRLHLTLQSKKSVISIQQDSAKNWFLILANSHDTEPKSVTLLDSSFYSKFLIVLNYKDRNRSYYSILIFKDSVSGSKFKHLTTRLKLINTKKS